MNENDMPRWIHEEAERRDAEVTRKLEEYYMELGESYMKGEGVEKNEEEAQEWFRKAAELKSKDAAATETPSAPASAPASSPEVTSQSPTSVCTVTPGKTVNESAMIHWVREAAERGDAEAAMKLGESYMKGEGVEKNEEEALEWFRKAAELKSKGTASPETSSAPTPQPMPPKKSGRRKPRVAGVAMVLALVIGGGIGAYYMLREDPYVAYQRLIKEGKEGEAMERLHVAAEDGNVSAQTDLGKCYYEGKGESKELTEAVKWWRKAADQGYARAQCNLGLCYLKGDGVSKDMEEVVKWYRLAADQGYAKAQFNLGWCYETGNGVDKDITEAVKWYRLAADQGYAEAQCLLGLSYENGERVSKDMEEAVKWYLKAAEQGDAQAQFNLGVCYANGRGVSKDMTEAVRLYRLAAEQGDAQAQYNLGGCYDNGDGVSKDMAEAVRLYRLAAEQGHAGAQFNLGVCHANGNGVSKDMVEAVKWWSKAAEQGYATAQQSLGWCYQNGKEGTREAAPENSFRVADYRRDGSRFASAGNTYVFYGRVENIETIGNNRIVSISIPDNPDERLPLLVPGSVRLGTNLTRGDRFVFETTCTTGRAPDGSQVKGVLIVRNAQSK